MLDASYDINNNSFTHQVTACICNKLTISLRYHCCVEEASKATQYMK